jgi:ABC-type lipoprotein release transport system permease subunit
MFLIFYSQGYMIAIFGAIIGICFSLFFVLFLELAILQFKKYEELQKQTKLLEELKNKN